MAVPRLRPLLHHARERIGGMPAVLWVLLVACALPEMVLEGADAGLWGTPQWRTLAYSWGGFWPGLLHGWQPNYAAQPWAMFVTYGFLHGGLAHVTVNMISLVSLGLPIIARVDQRRFALLYAVALVGGGLGYGLLSTAPTPMVGASGALFGLAGAWVAWDYADQFAAGEVLWPVLRMVALLVGLNLAMWWAMAGQLAWQTHLGGFVAGWIMAWLVDPRPRAPG